MATTYLCIDFGANRNAVRNKTIFSNNLEDQFSNLVQYKGWDFEDFVRSCFLLENSDVFVSYPNFNREPYTKEMGRDGDKFTITYYNNVAIRFPQGKKENDLVLMGDIMEKSNGHRIFNVKAILTVSPNVVHYGELQLNCSIVLKLQDKGNWETAGDWEGPKPSWDHINNSSLTNDFMLKLNQQYVVPDAEKVFNELNEWNNYLESRFYLIKTDEAKGYELGECVPDVFKAYTTGGKVDVEEYGRIQYLNGKQTSAWTLESVNDTSREAILMHIYVDCQEKAYLAKKDEKVNEKKRFDGFTRSPLVLVDPSVKADKFGPQGLSIREKRIEASYYETVEPVEELTELDRECEQRIVKLKADQEKAYMSEVSSKLNTFKTTVLPKKAAEYRGGQSESVRNRITLECETQISSETERIDSQYTSRKNEQSSIRSEISEKRSAHLGTNKVLLEVKEQFATLTKDRSPKELRNYLEDLRKKVKEEKHPDKSMVGEIEQIESVLSKIDDLQKNINALDKSVRASESELGKLELKLKSLSDSLTALDNEKKALPDKYDPEPLIQNELDRLEKQFREQMLEEEESRLRTLLRPEYDLRISRGTTDIKVEIDTRKDNAKTEHNIARFHVYFELEVPENENLEANLKSFSKYQKPGLILRKDYFGDKVLLKRQQEALNYLMNGYVLNPFLATFLFSPKARGKSVVSRIDHFFSDTLNDSQKEAVEKALSSNGLFLIQGPPGTGKTQVIAEITAQLAASGRKVLIASQNNKAVDNAFSRIPKIPMVRPMRILSENANKQKNPYSMAALLSNFYTNLSDSMESEVSKYEHRQKFEKELDGYIDELKGLLDEISKLENETEEVNSKIRKADADLQAEYAERDRIENSNFNMEDKQEQKDNEIESILEFEDDKFLAKILRELGELGFSPSDYGNDRSVLKSMYATAYEDIVSEYSKRIEHMDYFELKKEKSEASAPNEIARINKEMKYYCEDNDFSEKEEFPFLSSLVSVPDKGILLECKKHLDTIMGKKVSSLRAAKEALSEDKQDLSGVKAEIARLKERIESLKKDAAYQRLSDAEKRFDTKAKEIFVKLRIGTLWKTRADAISELKREKRRIEDEFSSNHDEVEERVKAYRRMSKYLSSEEVIKKDSETYVQVLLKTVNVIGMTCSAKANFKDNAENNIMLNEMNIDVVIVDEVSKVPFVEILQPILFGKTVILVGDHKQLPPMFDRRLNDGEENSYDPRFINPEKEEMYKSMYEHSFFAKLFDDSPESMKSPLRIQYRMHPHIMDVDNVFYGGDLVFGGNEADKEHYLEIYGASGKRIIGRDNHVVFVNVEGKEKKEAGSTSYTNPEEVRTVRKLLELINKNCRLDRKGQKLLPEYRSRNDERLSVGVICPYADQAREIRKNKEKYRSFNDRPDEKFMVKSVDDFQGDERDIIILSMVRTKKSDFLRDFRRINVAISRARCLLIIVGNRKALESMNVMLDGTSVPVYRNMIRAIERKNGVLQQNAITGGE